MTRAQLLQEAIIDGLLKPGAKNVNGISLVQDAIFKMDQSERIIVQCPRKRLEPFTPMSDEFVELLRDAIDEGTKCHGFYDAVTIEP